MPKAEFIPIEEAKAMRRRIGIREKQLEEYKAYIRKLSPDTAGRLTLAKEDKPITIRNRLMRAATVLSQEIEAHKFGSQIVFWLKE